MGPRRTRFWLPFVRLSAFFVAAVVGGNLLLYSVSSSSPNSRQIRRDTDFYSRQKKKIDRSLRMFERLFDSSQMAPPGPAGGFLAAAAIPVLAHSGTDGGGAEDLPVVPAERRGEDPAPAAYVEPEIVLALPMSLDAEPVGFVWPEPMPPLARREIDLPRSLSEFPLTSMGSGHLALEWHRMNTYDVASDVGDQLLRGPELVVDGILSLAGLMIPNDGQHVWTQDQSDGIASRILDLDLSPRRGRIFSDFLGRWIEREQRFFSKFEDSHLNTFGFEDGTGEMDMGDLGDEQRKILWDTLRKTYFGKYKFKAEEKIRDEAFYFNQWRGVDFAVLPPLMAGYLYYRGYDKKISIGATSLRLSIEPLSDWISGNDDIVAGVSAEWMVKGFPVGLIATAGMYDGDIGFDFIGIGTSVGMAKKILNLHRED